jgi:hypothetical protein
MDEQALETFKQYDNNHQLTNKKHAKCTCSKHGRDFTYWKNEKERRTHEKDTRPLVHAKNA